jgi:2,5-furandicarboxylate decarboxylase 1
MSNADVLDTRFRSALRRMAEHGRLRTYDPPADPKLEIAAIMKKFDDEDAAILFGNVTGFEVPVIGNMLSNRRNCEAAFG